MIENKYGVNGTVLDNIFFTEENISNAKNIKHLHIEISRQNSNLSAVKKQLASQAKSFGANAIMNFTYGQRKHKTWELVLTFKWDTESWHGEGDAVVVE